MNVPLWTDFENTIIISSMIVSLPQLAKVVEQSWKVD